MCIICGCASCGADDVLGTDTDPYNLIEVGTVQGGTANFKWGNDIRGAQSDQITWSLNLAGLKIIAGYSLAQFEEAVFDAFETWAAVAGLNFQFVATAGGADIDINVESLAGGTIGIARTSYFTSDSNGNGLVEIAESNVSIDRDESWRPNGPDGPFSFFQVVLHEIGHALGLDHFNSRDAVMNASANAGARLLGADDIAGIQDLYGAKRWTDSAETADFSYVDVGQIVSAGGGNDTLIGSPRGDRLSGDGGNDIISGAGGNDQVTGGNGNDRLVDTRGNNDIVGGSGNDSIIGGHGRIDAEGDSGNDVIIGGIGNDTLDGGSGDDRLFGDPAGGYINGRDRLEGGSGSDVLTGGGGADVFIFNRNDDSDRITDFETGLDRIDLSDFNLTFSQVRNFLNDSGNNVVFSHQGTVITIENISQSDLDAGDFIL